MPRRFIPPQGGYENLLSFQKARIVYDATVRFCDRFVGKRDRTRDQMIPAARSGKQTIVEARQASGTSKEMEMKLLNIARALRRRLVSGPPAGLRATCPRMVALLFSRGVGIARDLCRHLTPPGGRNR